MIDLIKTMAPPTAALQGPAARALAEVAGRADLGETVRVHRRHGDAEDRRLAAEWIAPRLGETPVPGRVLLTGGVQTTLLVLFAAYAAEGRAILSEALTYMPVDHVCDWLRLENHGVAIDREGLDPDALARACAAVGPAVLYCNPTLHNPTTGTLSAERRAAVAAVARAHDLIVIEDDVHGFLAPNGPPPLAAFAPERCWHLTTLSKLLGFGLRQAVLVAPSVAAAEAIAASAPSFSGWFTPGLSAAMTSALIRSGDIGRIAEAVRDEVAARQAGAATALGPRLGLRTDPFAPHLWLELASADQADRLVADAAAAGVALRSSQFYARPGRPAPAAIRLSATAARDRAEVAEGFGVVGVLLDRMGG